MTLDEHRPFFVENNALFADQPLHYFYSRRIGGLPRTLPAADELDLPSQVRILGAVAAGGYVAPHTQIAMLGAVTDQATADAIVDGKQQALVVAPFSGGPRAASSTRSAHPCSVRRPPRSRAISANTGLEPLLPSSALVAGGDAKLRTPDGTYELDLYGGTSDVNGSAAAINALEQSSTHYFQRPDAAYLAPRHDRAPPGRLARRRVRREARRAVARLHVARPGERRASISTTSACCSPPTTSPPRPSSAAR